MPRVRKIHLLVFTVSCISLIYLSLSYMHIPPVIRYTGQTYLNLHAGEEHDYTGASAWENTAPENQPTPRLMWGKSQCNVELLDRNDSESAVNNCTFPFISQSSTLNEYIDKLNRIQLPLLQNYRSPCWYEMLDSSAVEEYRAPYHMFPGQAHDSFSRMIPILGERLKQCHPWRLRCLPLVYIIGVAKCGTSDLYETLVTHDDVIPGATKEPFFWDWGRWKKTERNTISDFLNLYDEAAERIRKHVIDVDTHNKHIAYHPAVTIDASVNTLFTFGGSDVLPGNIGQSEPKYIAAHLIHNLTPSKDIKIIVMVRNPTERLFSSYVFFNTVTHPNKISSNEFHRLVTTQVTKLTRCFSNTTISACLYNKDVITTYKTVDVNAGIYYEYIKDWIQVFPGMKVIRLEDYRANRTGVYTDLLTYLDLPRTRSARAESTIIEGTGPVAQFKMLHKTKILLDNFYKPFNRNLAKLLNDDRFLFD